MRVGDDVALRYITRDGRVGHTWAARLLEDTAQRVLLYLPRGTPHKRWGRGENAGQLLDASWTSDTLRFMYPGRAHSIWASWHPDGSFWGYYVNLEEPYRRTPIGFDTNDHHLDIVVGSDLRWFYKDEPALDDREREGTYSSALIAQIRREADDVTRVIEAGGSPFDEGWERWRPDPSWTIPALDERWRTEPPALWERRRWAYPLADDPASSESG